MSHVASRISERARELDPHRQHPKMRGPSSGRDELALKAHSGKALARGALILSGVMLVGAVPFLRLAH